MAGIKVTVDGTKEVGDLIRSYQREVLGDRLPARIIPQWISPSAKTFLRNESIDNINERLKGNKSMIKGVRVSESGRGRRKIYSIDMTGPAKVYAKIQNYGGTIRPKNHEHLAIPLDFVKQASTGQASMRDFPSKTTFLREKKGYKIVYLKDKYSPDNRNTPLFALVKQTVIKKTAWATDAVKALQNYKMEQIVRDRSGRIAKDLARMARAKK